MIFFFIAPKKVKNIPIIAPKKVNFISNIALTFIKIVPLYTEN